MYKNLAFIIPGLKNGGAERVLSTLSLNLNKNITQYIFTLDGKEKDYDFNSEIIDFNIINSNGRFNGSCPDHSFKTFINSSDWISEPMNGSLSTFAIKFRYVFSFFIKVIGSGAPSYFK